MSRNNWSALGCAAFVGAAVAFPAGLILGGRDAIHQKDGREGQSDTASGEGIFRNIYSPKIHSDPYVQDQWKKGIEALEEQCRHTGQRCAEAKAGRHWLNEKW